MALFHFGKKEKKTPACACSSDCPAGKASEIVGVFCPEAKDGIYYETEPCVGRKKRKLPLQQDLASKNL